MGTTITSAQLDDLVAALRRFANHRPKAPSFRRVASAIDQGWLTKHDLESVINTLPLPATWAMDPSGVVELFKLRWTNVGARPTDDEGISFFESISVFDLAALLIRMEAVGLPVDPSELVFGLLPTVKKLPRLTESQLDILWYRQQRHKRPAAVFSTDHKGHLELDGSSSWKTVSGYVIQTKITSNGGAVVEICSPKYRFEPAPTLVTCEICATSYLKGMRFDEKIHAKAHRRSLSYLDPQPSKKWALSASKSSDPELVTARSPTWKHELMYLRALAFKREFKYDFVQWGNPETDANAQGILFAHEDRLIGACAFRHRVFEGHMPIWALQWAWIAPGYRRQGHLERRWPDFIRRFGAFYIEPPLSDAMKGFIEKHGYRNPLC